MRLTQRRTITCTHCTTSTCPGPPDTTGSDFKGPGIEMMDIKILNGTCSMHVYVLQNIVKTWSSEKGEYNKLINIPEPHFVCMDLNLKFSPKKCCRNKIHGLEPSKNEN